MQIEVKVIPRAKRRGVKQLADGRWRVAVTAPAEDGRANAAVIEALAETFKVRKTKVRIVRGFTNRIKQIEIIKEGIDETTC